MSPITNLGNYDGKLDSDVYVRASDILVTEITCYNKDHTNGKDQFLYIT